MDKICEEFCVKTRNEKWGVNQSIAIQIAIDVVKVAEQLRLRYILSEEVLAQKASKDVQVKFDALLSEEEKINGTNIVKDFVLKQGVFDEQCRAL